MIEGRIRRGPLKGMRAVGKDVGSFQGNNLNKIKAVLYLEVFSDSVHEGMKQKLH